jgi:hypothetical protein
MSRRFGSIIDEYSTEFLCKTCGTLWMAARHRYHAATRGMGTVRDCSAHGTCSDDGDGGGWVNHSWRIAQIPSLVDPHGSGERVWTI